MSFEHFGLCAEIKRAIAEHGYANPTEIQKQAIEPILKGHDILAGSQTGTGKTAAFALPILQLLTVEKSSTNKHASQKARLPRTLVLTPTRELAAQVCQSFQDYGKHTAVVSCEIFGGVSIVPQKQKISRGVDVLVATPGRLLDHISQRPTLLSEIEIFVLDEADRMLDMGFIHDIKKILRTLPAKRQNLMFSATYSPEIKKLAQSFLRDPVSIEINKGNSAAVTVEQLAYRVDKAQKRHLLAHLIRQQSWYQVLVFTRTKHGANRLAQQLSRANIETAAIHGNKSQGARTTALKQFKAGNVQVLVATDIAARGIDIVELPFVVNFDLPNVPEDYVHRIGRTGRAGVNGSAISLVDQTETKHLRDIEKLLGKKIPLGTVTGFEQVSEPSARDDKATHATQPSNNKYKHTKPAGRKPTPKKTNTSSNDKRESIHRDRAA